MITSSPQVREDGIMPDSVFQAWIPNSMEWIPDSMDWIPDSKDGILDSKGCITDWFQSQFFRWFPIPDFLTLGLSYCLHGIVPWAALRFCTGNTFPIVAVWSVAMGTGWVLPSLLGDTNPCSDGCTIFFAIPCKPPIAANSLDILPLATSVHKIELTNCFTS